MDEDELRGRFRELRAHDAKRAPRFDALTAKRPARSVRLLFTAAPLVAVAAVLLLWCGTQNHAAAPVASAPRPPKPRLHAAAALPLDFLLENAPVSVRLDANPIEGLRP